MTATPARIATTTSADPRQPSNGDCADGRLRLPAALMALGALAQVALGLLHPHQVQPNDSPGAFAEYAHSHSWVDVHLGQYLGTLLIAIGLIALSRSLSAYPGAAGQLARIAGTTAIVTTAVFAIQMAVDGIALKAAIDHWASSTAVDRAAAYGVADSVRALEKGLSALFHLNNGITLLALGSAMAMSRRPRTLGWVGAATGLGFIAEAAVTAHTGFSPEAGTLALLPTILFLVFLTGSARRLWQSTTNGPVAR